MLISQISSSRSFKWRGICLLAIAAPTNQHGQFEALFYSRWFQTLSNIVSNHGFTGKLAMNAGVEPREMGLVEVRFTRGTSLLKVIFATTDQATAERVAPNAGPMLISYYATNQPTITTEFIDSYVQPVPSLWRQILNKLIP
jgi:hypothetical protein